MLWIAYDPGIMDPKRNREQFNGDRPAWGESQEDFEAKQGIDVPLVGDRLYLRMGRRVVVERRLEMPERDGEGNSMSGWYWTLFVR